MEVKKIDSQTAVIHLPEYFDTEDAPKLKQSLQSLYEEGILFIDVDFTVTKNIQTPGPGLLVLYHKKLSGRGGELKLLNVTDDNIKHFFDMIDFAKVIKIEMG